MVAYELMHLCKIHGENDEKWTVYYAGLAA
jgi:hypothetical protein